MELPLNKRELRILILEDTASDAELLEYTLRKAGVLFTLRHVDTAPAFRQALTEFNPDIVLADYHLPTYSGREALEYVQQNFSDVPVIMVTGAIGEEMAVELLRAGAKDYILKDRMARLPAAIQRVLEEQSAIRARRESEKNLRETERKFRMLFETANDGIFVMNAAGLVDCNQKAASMMGLDRLDIIGHSPDEFCQERQPNGRLSSEVVTEKTQAAFAGQSEHFEWRVLRADDTTIDVDINLNRIELGGEVYLQAVVRDITGRKRVEDALRASESRFRLLVENAPMCIHEMGLDGRISAMNQAGLCMLGIKNEAEVHGYLYLDAVANCDHERISELLDRAYAGETSHFEFKSSGPRGQTFGSCFVPIKNQSGGVEKLMGIMEDITERKRAEEVIRNFAFFDALTQLPNRRLLNDRLRQAMLASKRNSHYGALMFLDMDNFKPLNDTHGHDAGDLLLVEASRRIARCVREIDTVARFGGDEFVIMLSELDIDKTESMKQAGIVAEKIRSSLSEPYVLTLQQGDEIQTIVHHCTSSVGVALFLNHDTEQEEIIKLADRAMYQAKADGRNTIRFLDTEANSLKKSRKKNA